jgi:hypothetical protein
MFVFSVRRPKVCNALFDNLMRLCPLPCTDPFPGLAHLAHLSYLLLCAVPCAAAAACQVIGVKLTGRMSKWTSPKDVILKVGLRGGG